MTGTLWVRQRKTLIKNVRDNLWYKIRLNLKLKGYLNILTDRTETQRKSYVYKRDKVEL